MERQPAVHVPHGVIFGKVRMVAVRSYTWQPAVSYVRKAREIFSPNRGGEPSWSVQSAYRVAGSERRNVTTAIRRRHAVHHVVGIDIGTIERVHRVIERRVRV